jgi:putative N6-adenine-specific DNA methylase
MFAISAPGLERIAAWELEQMGIAGAVTTEGGVAFSGDLALLYNANLSLRTAGRVVVRVAEFHASTFHELERRAQRIRWDEYLIRGSRVQFRVTCRKSRLYHSDAVAERFVRAIVQQIGEIDVAPAAAESSEEQVDAIAAEVSSQLFIVRLSGDNCVVSADSSGALLHRRGYRQAIGKAPLRETLAAAMVIRSGWDQRATFLDPMCGSGTIAIEAALIARRIAPGLRRGFAFQRWPRYEPELWESVKTGVGMEAISSSGHVLLGSDRDDGAVRSARTNAERAGVLEDIDFRTRPISAIDLPRDAGFIITNPPYGIRVGNRGPLRNLYAQLGKVLRNKANGYTVGLLSADRTLESRLGIPLKEVFRTRNGGIPVRFVKGKIE